MAGARAEDHPVKALVAIVAAVACGAGCRAPAKSVGPYQPPANATRETSEAERLTKEAAELIKAEPQRAETLLREALTKDLFFGPAHNNLGVVLLQRDELYTAAEEFEWARKLMPGHPDPRVNLALTLEKAGKIDDAIASYSAALEVYPDYLPAVQGLALMTVRAGRKDDRLTNWLETIAIRSDSVRWREWAKRRQSMP
jgi:tetratricopeptide (TPR) repeat protein